MGFNAIAGSYLKVRNKTGYPVLYKRTTIPPTGKFITIVENDEDQILAGNYIFILTRSGHPFWEVSFRHGLRPYPYSDTIRIKAIISKEVYPSDPVPWIKYVEKFKLKIKNRVGDTLTCFVKVESKDNYNQKYEITLSTKVRT